MIPAEGGRDPWTGAPILSLYGDAEQTAAPVARRPSPGSTCC